MVDGSVTMGKLDAAIQTEFRQYMLDAQVARDVALNYQKYAKQYLNSPRKGRERDTKYDLLNLVTHDGSSYVAHTDPPKGTLPTDASYWQVSAQGTGKATAAAYAQLSQMEQQQR